LKTLHKYLTGQVLAALLLTVSVFAFVVLLMNVLHDVLPLLFGGHITVWLALKAIGLLIPFACVYALPMGFITATLLVFGRFSADQELTAARAGGASLVSLVWPVLLLSLLCCGLSAWFNMDVGPRARAAFVNLKSELLANLANAEIPEGTFIRDFHGFIFYTEKNNDGDLENVFIYRLRNETNIDTTIHAERGRLNPQRAANQLVIDLYEASAVTVNEKGNTFSYSPKSSFNFSSSSVTNRVTKPGITDMTFVQLQQELHDLENLNLPAMGTNSSAELRAQLQMMQQQKKDSIEPVLVTMHFQFAFAFACFSFALIGIPLGIRVHRRETNVGILMALILVVVYYAFIMLGRSLEGHPQFYPHLILWLPNFIFQAVGVVLLRRANRGI
jgi:lipopolysaccharide export system permease protein